jgi:hypothetical protein
VHVICWKFIWMSGIALGSSNLVKHDAVLFGILLPTLRRFCTLFRLIEPGRKREKNSPKRRQIFASLHGVTYLKILIPKFISAFRQIRYDTTSVGPPQHPPPHVTTTTTSSSLSVQPRHLQVSVFKSSLFLRLKQ